MKNSLFVFLILSLLTVASLSQAAIFGNDDRLPVYSFSPKANLGRATAIALLTGNSTFSADKKTVDIDAEPLSGTLCSDQKFVSDISLSYSCTGFLVAPDLLVTAGHCMSNHSVVQNETGGYCEVFDWLFDYQSTPTSAPMTKAIPTDKVYHCKQIIYAVQDEVAPFRDYALVQLDRPVLDRQPLKIATAPVQKGESVTMLGYPLGSPLKFSFNAKVVLTNPAANAFVTNLDAFDGNSGSPVLNAQDEVVGILVAGTPEMSLIEDTAHGCRRYNRCDEDGKNCLVPDADPSHISGFQTTGSDVERIAPVLELIRQHQNK